MANLTAAAQAAADAAERVQAVLDARPAEDDRPSSHILWTIPHPDGRGWLHLTESDLRALLADRLGMLRAIRDLATLTEDQWTCGDNKPLYGAVLALRNRHAAAIATLPAATCECGCQPGRPCGCGLEDCECIGDCPVCDADGATHVLSAGVG